MNVFPAGSAERLGLVLMHGKEESPARAQALADALAAAGNAVERPEMCWSRRRAYDRPFIDCLLDIDLAVAKLKAEGFTGIVVAGIGLGGNAAIAYGARRDGIRGVIALGPAPAIEFFNRRPPIAASLVEAQAMITAGKGEKRASFADFAADRLIEVETTAAIYVSFFGNDSIGIMPENAARLRVPILIVSGSYDPSQRSIPYVFARAPSNPRSWHVIVISDQRGAARAAENVVIAWLKILDGR